jgi:CubicO group peptidase (beta-lactamase class C family)
VLEPDGVHGLTIDEADVQAYIALIPDRGAGVRRGRAEVSPMSVIRPPLPTPFPGWRLNVERFVAAVVYALTDSSAGYVMELRQNDEPLASVALHDAVDGAAEGDISSSVLWSPQVRMHIASCSKMLTAMALTKLLNDNKISYDAPIFPYLPSYWVPGSNVELISFADLMRHTSGLVASSTDSGPETYFAARAAVEAGASQQDIHIVRVYQNVNFILCRVLIATINGNGDVTAEFVLNDPVWDYVTMSAYSEYLSLWIVYGIPDVVLTRPQECALAYTWPVSGPGWNSGDLSWTAGAAGWHMTVEGLLDVMGRFRREGSVLTPGQAQETLARGFAVDPTGLPRRENADATLAGPVYAKNGLQWNGSEIEQCVAFYLPDNMELVVFVNSPVFSVYPSSIVHTGAPTGDFLLGLIAAIYADNLEYVL